MNFLEHVEDLGLEKNCDMLKKDFAMLMDKKDELKAFRNKFFIPMKRDLPIKKDWSSENGKEHVVYMCGNSLGLQPKSSMKYVKEVLKDWKNLGVLSHMNGFFQAAGCDQVPKGFLVDIVGAKHDKEISILNGLTVNIHLLLSAFYKPNQSGRYKIVIEDHAFRSDRYAVTSHMKLKGINPEEGLIEVQPDNCESWIRTEKILKVIEENADSIAIVFFSGVQYYTGQKFDMEKITKFAKSKGCLVGWDLAHAVGNVELKLHDWSVDFAAWCSYKYCNGGAGNMGGIFIHEKLGQEMPHHLQGWFGASNKFQMIKNYTPVDGADCMRLSNPPPLLIAAQYAGLEILSKAGMTRIVAKQRLLTGYLEFLIKRRIPSNICQIITPPNPQDRGSQLSITFFQDMTNMYSDLTEQGLICDFRNPSVLRISPCPLYNSFLDVWKVVSIIAETLEIDHFNSINNDNFDNDTRIERLDINRVHLI